MVQTTWFLSLWTLDMSTQASMYAAMNVCRRTACGGDWSSGLNVLLSRQRCLRTAPSWVRGRSAAAKHAPGSDAAEKPRLRAIDLARAVQREKAEKSQAAEAPKDAMSPQQRRVTELKQFSQQLQHVHPNVLAKHLHRGVLYQDQDLVVINKPYGVPVRDDSGAISISSVLPVLSIMMEGRKARSGSQLLPCVGLEKETTGALLLARSEQAAEHVLSLHRDNQVHKKFWVVTVGVPVPSEGVIDIPIIERQVSGPQPHYKMALSPVYKMNDAGNGVTKVRSHRQAHSAVTKYRVLDSSSGCSLVELQPFTGVKNQMRVHMAFALACPILGDHKYSHWSKLAPQKLPERVLAKLGLEQSKARHVPLHLHSRQLILPGTSEGDISVSCPLPRYFTQTLKRLNLILDDEKNK